MLELILSTLAEFGLLREDFKHHRNITKKEKEDGIKRPVQRYILRPSSVITIAVFIIGIITAAIFVQYQQISIFPKKTKKEIAEICDRMESWNENLGKYPTELKELIGNNPLRQNWNKDSWNREYKFIVSENGKEFLVASAGSDGIFGTEDDIISKNIN